MPILQSRQQVLRSTQILGWVDVGMSALIFSTEFNFAVSSVR